MGVGVGRLSTEAGASTEGADLAGGIGSGGIKAAGTTGELIDRLAHKPMRLDGITWALGGNRWPRTHCGFSSRGVSGWERKTAVVLL